MNINDYPNRDALRKANDIYLDAMRVFIVHNLRQIPDYKVEHLIEQSLSDNQIDNFYNTLDESDEIKSSIDFSYIPNIIRYHWSNVFDKFFGNDLNCQSMLWLIKMGRNKTEHRGTKDLEIELTRAHLFLIVNILEYIKKTEDKKKVEEIRDQLLNDKSSSEILLLTEKLTETEEKKNKYKNDLREAEKEIFELNTYKKEYDELNKTIENLKFDKGKIEEKFKDSQEKNLKLRKDLKETEDAWKQTEQSLTDTNAKLDQEEEDNRVNLKCIDALNNKINDFINDLKLKDEKLKTTHDEKLKFEQDFNETKQKHTILKEENEKIHEKIASLTEHIGNLNDIHQEEINSIKLQNSSITDEKSIVENQLSSIRNQIQYLTGNNQLSTQAYPNLTIDSPVRMLDSRNEDKKEYILNLIDRKLPTIFYVMNEYKLKQFIRLVGHDQSEIIGTHSAFTTKDDEIKLTEKLKNGELAGIVSSGTLSHLITRHNIEHIVFCHLPLSLNIFVNQCQPAFLSNYHCFIHLIYNPVLDMNYIMNSYPDRDALEGFFHKLKCINGIKTRFVTIDYILSKLKMEKTTFEPLCNIFQEIGMIEINNDGVKLLSNPKKNLIESTVFNEGVEEREKYQEFYDFQKRHSCADLWDKIAEKTEISNILKDYDNTTIVKKSEIEEKLEAIESENTDSSLE